MLVSLFLATGCADIRRDEVLPPTEQEIEQSKRIVPQGAIREGVFHMQRVNDGSDVRVREQIELKRPGLPPFDVAYISRDLESILLELANAAGESVVIPQGLRNRKITLIHSGADFEQMLSLVLRKAGYHYNYIDGVWYVTRYPIRSYVLEISQSTRGGGLRSEDELTAEEAEGQATGGGGTPLESTYEDSLWEEVESTIGELIQVGQTEVRRDATASGGVTGAGNALVALPEGGVADEGDTTDGGLLPPPSLEGLGIAEDELFGTLSESGTLTPQTVTTPESNDHLVEEEENANPWYRITRGAGMVTVRAAPEAHRLIEDYLGQVQESARRQVLVEARIIAVVRDKTTDRGADFDITTDFGNTVLGQIGFEAATPLSIATQQGGFVNFTSNKNDMTGVIQALSQIADVYTISSPSTLVRNNQLSRVSITRQLGYVETEVETNTDNTGDVTIGTRTDTVKFKNAGTVMSVLPFIGRSRTHLRFRLSIASRSGDTPIQTTIGDNETVTNLVPELSTNVIDQDIMLDFGRVYAIGGLIESSTNMDSSYAPLLNLIPGMQDVFQRAQNRKQDTEFMVLLKVSRL